ncbi:MarR family winged helix-turn-helix transcriptional regulator [Paenibacillus radicis (ex Xue et al. 2023)]|uniref:MarR family transcriptional regulator n=1 Tax=Paenibacillus radicis (ex Xue et al. 2023) TaxID=2972489 RepID=A0ABT1YQH8_9BACL|nr:MarR family transcriptional regulator [Paenibacillus radicis (ex Xue et al. 2023)]MCR8635439.1 MarR family transcriptional regulator [Paenibacillus radicis (ex Xue et al. 2023)]
MPNELDKEHASSLKLFVVLSKAYRTVMDRAVKDMKEYGLSPSEFMILEVLYTKGKIPLQQIGEKILITSGSITYNIDKLEKKGLLKRVPCKDDRRVIFAEITTEGNAMFDRIFPDHAATIHSLTKALSQDEKLIAVELLKKLGKGAEEQ